MPTDDRPIRDVLREVEELEAQATPAPWKEVHVGIQHPEGDASDWWEFPCFEEVSTVQGAVNLSHAIACRNAAPRLARELRAIAPMLREAALKIYVNRHPGPVPDIVRALRAKADELEAK